MLTIDQLYTATVWSIFSPWEVSEGISAHFSSYLKVPPLDKEIYINSKCARLEVDIQNWNCNKKLGELVSFFNSSLGLKSLPMSCAICSSNTFTLCYTNLWYNKTAQQWTYAQLDQVLFEISFGILCPYSPPHKKTYLGTFKLWQKESHIFCN